jgi:hypothetical protein
MRTGLENKKNTGVMGPHPRLRDSIGCPIGDAQRGAHVPPPRGQGTSGHARPPLMWTCADRSHAVRCISTTSDQQRDLNSASRLRLLIYYSPSRTYSPRVAVMHVPCALHALSLYTVMWSERSERPAARAAVLAVRSGPLVIVIRYYTTPLYRYVPSSTHPPPCIHTCMYCCMCASARACRMYSTSLRMLS